MLTGIRVDQVQGDELREVPLVVRHGVKTQFGLTRGDLLEGGG